MTFGNSAFRYLASMIIFAFVASGPTQAVAVTGELATRTAVEVVCINTTDNGVLFDFLTLIDLSKIDMDARNHDQAIPHAELKSSLPGAPAGWGLPLETSGGNESYSWAEGVYMSDDRVVWVSIHDRVTEWSYELEENWEWKNWGLILDESYPTWHIVNGYPAFEIRSTGPNAPEGAYSFGGLFVGLTESVPVPEPADLSLLIIAIGLVALRSLLTSRSFQVP